MYVSSPWGIALDMDNLHIKKSMQVLKLCTMYLSTLYWSNFVHYWSPINSRLTFFSIVFWAFIYVINKFPVLHNHLLPKTCIKYSPSIRDRVHCKKNLALNKQFFQFFQTFSKKKKIYVKAILCNFSMRLLKCFLKNFRFFFAP